jgi:hypothetical protein
LLQPQKILVGAIGFEPTTPCAQGRCATRLRYAPTLLAELILKHFPILFPLGTMIFSLDRARTVTISRSLRHNRGNLTTCFFSKHLVGVAIELLQCLALHLQLHLRILFDDLRVSLTKHLRYPLVRHASRTQRRVA